MSALETIDLKNFQDPISKEIQNKAVKELEEGKLIFLPNVAFSLKAEELSFLDPAIVDPKSKNISYDNRNDRLSGTSLQGLQSSQLKEMMRRYADQTKAFMEKLFPHYKPNLIQARTSFRPIEAFGRIQSYKKDDTRIHVDAFPSSPTGGERIIRFFTNVNKEGKPRVWRVGEPFQDVVKKLAPKLKKPVPGLRHLLHFFKITKNYRTLYDHYMLELHDEMKRNLHYQAQVPQEEIRFLPGNSWIVYSDQVSHAAMSGQHLFEQTFHLPVLKMENPEKSPLKILEKFFHKELI